MATVDVLVVDDELHIRKPLAYLLKKSGYTVETAQDGIEAIEKAETLTPKLIFLDIMMPRKDGFTFAREVRGMNNQIPLIFLTAKSLKEDRIEGFRIGCDDYITKPFSVEELQLRMEAVLRRSQPAAADEDIPTRFEIGEYQFDSVRQLLNHQDEERKLTARESELLALLCLNVNQVLEREHALKEIWGDSSYFSGRSMDVFVSKLRKYLKHDSKVSIISIHGRGLRLVVG